MAATVFVFALVVPGIAIAILVLASLRGLRRRAQKAGYATRGAYLRAAPQTDEEKRDAADLALKGVVICLLGLLFPPLILFGLFPLFYGTRKLVYAGMGLGLVDDGDEPQRPRGA